MPEIPELKVTLLAGGTEVASTTDAAIWLSTMAAITGLAEAPLAGGNKSGGGGASKPEAAGASKSESLGDSAEARFAAELEVTPEQLLAAASPSQNAPFIHLDHKYWEALKGNTPPRGVGSVPGVILAATLLLLWNRHSHFGKVTATMCDAVLATINHSERNRARSLRGCEWIQVREDGLRLNPASTALAIRLARAYVTKEALR